MPVSIRFVSPDDFKIKHFSLHRRIELFTNSDFIVHVFFIFVLLLIFHFIFALKGLALNVVRLMFVFFKSGFSLCYCSYLNRRSA